MSAYTNTVKTVLGFLRAFLSHRVPGLGASEQITDIYNYLPINGLYATSGQPSESQFLLIKNAGYDTVFNLAPNSILENTVINEAQILAKLGIAYEHIPVDFKAPSEQNFIAFTQALKRHAAHKIWVHCAANMRVSAFTYRYRYLLLNEDKRIAEADLHKIWQPFGVWKKFIKGKPET